MMISLNEGAIGRAALIVGTIQVQTVKDNHFSLLRHKFGVPDNFLDGQFDFGKLTSGGGKGGDLMARSFDDRYFVKQLNKGDGRSLLDEAFLREYIEVVSKARCPLRICICINSTPHMEAHDTARIQTSHFILKRSQTFFYRVPHYCAASLQCSDIRHRVFSLR